MTLNIVVGTQWGDEGKGRIVDLLSAESDIVARYSGGDNAGHTVTVKDNIFKLHLIPSGIIHRHTTGILGDAMVINPITFSSETETLRDAGVLITPERLKISSSAHLITPAHRLLDKAQEEWLAKGKIGTTGRGIGPAYVDKAARRGLRAQDIIEPNFLDKVSTLVNYINAQIQDQYHQPAIDSKQISNEFYEKAIALSPYICDTGHIIREALLSNRVVLAEGAQGTLLDLDHGSYPFVTSSTTLATGVFSGLGIGITPVERIIGVTKAFQTRVGAGPFPTEVDDNDSTKKLRGTGENPWDEFGTTTGRPRRVGWLDIVLLKYAIAINGLNELALTKMDILSGFDKIKICTAYRTENQVYKYPVNGVSAHQLGNYSPIYEELDGWTGDLRLFRSWNQLPVAARNYISRIEELCNIDVKLVSVGPERDEVIYKGQ